MVKPTPLIGYGTAKGPHESYAFARHCGANIADHKQEHSDVWPSANRNSNSQSLLRAWTSTTASATKQVQFKYSWQLLAACKRNHAAYGHDWLVLPNWKFTCHQTFHSGTRNVLRLDTGKYGKCSMPPATSCRPVALALLLSAVPLDVKTWRIYLQCSHQKTGHKAEVSGRAVENLRVNVSSTTKRA